MTPNERHLRSQHRPEEHQQQDRLRDQHFRHPSRPDLWHRRHARAVAEDRGARSRKPTASAEHLGEIVVKGPKFTVTLNGVKTVDGAENADLRRRPDRAFSSAKAR